MGFLSQKLGEPSMLNLRDALHSAKQSEVLNLLEKAYVTVGHLDGRHIHVPGYSTAAPSLTTVIKGSSSYKDWAHPQVTFTDFKERIEAIYEEKMAPMREAVDQYLQDSGQIIHCKKWNIDAPRLDQLSGYDQIIHSFPQFPQAEIQEFKEALLWRDQVDAGLDKLYQRSHIWMNKRNSHCLSSANITRIWDNLCDKLSNWRVNHNSDWVKFNWLAQVQGKTVQKETFKERSLALLEELNNMEMNTPSYKKGDLSPGLQKLERRQEHKFIKARLAEIKESIFKKCDEVLEKIRLNDSNLTKGDVDLSEMVYSKIRAVIKIDRYRPFVDKEYLSSIYTKIESALAEIRSI